ncbi:2Fe-2S iron-sulfur cluster-binding protein [uncultured Xylophilus sp.]|uniref:2Fe-2S iron-sulfur cluster-binding protein n=1 Tax=uncultured Xylophilus sp. TaxID=296832 RepID=UPI0025D7B236|nr:2Fe-2S iron-sulfur cluster-binding protein [uncultured Xylophilus sp.]
MSSALPPTALPVADPAVCPTDDDAVFALRIDPQGWTAEAPSALTLREAAAFAGIELPTSCRNGTCRACLCRMTAGAVRYRIAWPGLSADEKAEGYVLPCVAHPTADVVLEAPGAVRLGAIE